MLAISTPVPDVLDVLTSSHRAKQNPDFFQDSLQNHHPAMRFYQAVPPPKPFYKIGLDWQARFSQDVS